MTLYPPAGLTAAVVNGYPGNTTFCLTSGTYAIPGSIIVPSGDSFVGQGMTTTTLDFNGARLEGQNGELYGLYGYGGPTGQHDVTVQAMTIANCVSGTYSCQALKQGDNWKVAYVELRNNDIGGIGSCDHCFIHDNPHYGFLGYGVVSNSEIARNGGGCQPCIDNGDTGATKMVHYVTTVWRNNYIHDNFVGIWCDGCYSGTQLLIEGNRIENNGVAGVLLEITWGACTATTCVDGVDNSNGYAIVRNNTFKGNSYNQIGNSCWHSAQIEVQNSQGVVVAGNYIDSSNGANAICLTDTSRSDVFPVAPECISPFSATGNTIILAGPALVGEAGDETTAGCPAYTPQDLAFSQNTYRIVDGTSQHWSWWQGGSGLTFSQWQGYGLDSGSLVS